MNITFIARSLYSYVIALGIIIALSIFSTVFVGCSAPIYIASNSAEIIFATDAYHNTFPNKKPIVTFVSDNLDNLLATKQISILVSKIKNQNDRDLVKNKKFYPQSSLKILDKQYKLINNLYLLSYSLPYIITKKSTISKINSTINTQKNTDLVSAEDLSTAQKILEKHRITLKELQILTTTFTNKLSDHNYTLGFYPSSTLFNQLFIDSASYHNWMVNSQIDNSEIQNYYYNKYAVAPINEIIKDDKLIFKFISSEDYLKITEKEDYEVFILTLDNGQISVISSLYIGALQTTSQTQSTHFLKWLFSESAQQSIINIKNQYMQSILDNKISVTTDNQVSFIENHLSSLWKINTKYIIDNDHWLWQTQPFESQIVKQIDLDSLK